MTSAAPSMNAAKCRHTGKIIYPTRHGAHRAREAFARRPRQAERLRGADRVGERTVDSVYLCPWCEGYHIGRRPESRPIR